jgi:hypothetical protein
MCKNDGSSQTSPTEYPGENIFCRTWYREHYVSVPYGWRQRNGKHTGCMKMLCGDPGDPGQIASEQFGSPAAD